MDLRFIYSVSVKSAGLTWMSWPAFISSQAFLPLQAMQSWLTGASSRGPQDLPVMPLLALVPVPSGDAVGTSGPLHTLKSRLAQVSACAHKTWLDYNQKYFIFQSLASQQSSNVELSWTLVVSSLACFPLGFLTCVSRITSSALFPPFSLLSIHSVEARSSLLTWGA